MKILISSHFPLYSSGYGRQTEFLIRVLYKYYPSIEIAVLCCNNWNVPQSIKPYTLDEINSILNISIQEENYLLFKKCKFYSAGNTYDIWPRIVACVDDFKCDKLIVYQDIWIFEKYDINSIKCKKYLYLPIHNDFREHKLLHYDNNVNSEIKTLHYLPFFDKIATFSSFGMEVLKIYGYDATFINHMIKDIQIQSTKEEIRKKYLLSNDLFICLMVARNNEKTDRKGFIQQLYAFALFAADKNNCKLIIHENVAKNNRAIDLEELFEKYNIRDKVIVTVGTMTNENIYEFYKMSNVLLCASKSEGFGIPMVEAQFAGLPVITTNCTAMTENTYYGICTEPSEVSTVINGLNSWSTPSSINIKNALEDIYIGATNKHNLRAIDKNKYSEETVFEQWKQFLEMEVVSNEDYKKQGNEIFQSHLSRLSKLFTQIPLRKIAPLTECKYAAVLIETRDDPSLETILLNMIHLTDITMGMQIFYHENTAHRIMDIISRNKIENISLVKINTVIHNNQDYNTFMFSKEFYDNVYGEKIVIYQLDSLLLKPFDMTYFQYDWVGAIWNNLTMSQPYLSKLFQNLLPIGNGGFNIRNITMCQNIVLKYNYQHPIIENVYFNEDNIYSSELQKQNANFPSTEEASKFSVETTYHPSPMAMHAIYKYVGCKEDCRYIQKLFDNHYSYYENINDHEK